MIDMFISDISKKKIKFFYQIQDLGLKKTRLEIVKGVYAVKVSCEKAIFRRKKLKETYSKELATPLIDFKEAYQEHAYVNDQERGSF